MNELQVKTASLEVVQGHIIFTNYEEIFDQAVQLRDYIESVEVTEDSIKATKKMLAAVNGKVKELEDKRIEVKKTILEPYNDLETKVKRIVNTVKEAEQEVRSKVRVLEERERVAKEVVIIDLFNKRKDLYPTLSMFEYGDFLTAKHLNKTTSINSIEQEMAEWFESKKRDIELISGFENVAELLTEYKETKDLSVAMSIVKERKERQEAVKQVLPKVEAIEAFTFQVTSAKDAKFVELLLQENNIDYKVVK